jgi:hypothetical protein
VLRSDARVHVRSKWVCGGASDDGTAAELPALALQDASVDRSKEPALRNVDAGTAISRETEPLAFDAVLNLLLDRKLTKLKPERLLPKLAALAPALAETKRRTASGRSLQRQLRFSK